MIHIPNLAEIIMNYEIAFGFLHTYLQFKIFEAKKNYEFEKFGK